MASSYAKFIYLDKKRAQLTQDWFGFLGNQHGGRFIVFGRQQGRRDVMRGRKLAFLSAKGHFRRTAFNVRRQQLR